MIIGKQVVYRGRVQGVGFRYTACQVAEEFDVQGFVRNLPGGGVELVVQGEAEVVEAFLGELTRRMAGYINQTIVTEVAPAGYKGFQIRF
jgi:acylphosphatase